MFIIMIGTPENLNHFSLATTILVSLDLGLNNLSFERHELHTPSLYFKTFFRGNSVIKVVLGGYPRCPDNHDLSKCHHLYDFGRHIEQP